MSYTKNIAVIHGIKDGFSSDGGNLSGLVKAERYGRRLTVEASLVNFAPLSQGRFVTAITDGKTTLVVENGLFDGESELNTDGGFAALVCFINGGVYPVATAICGNYRDVALGIKAEVERQENLKAEQKKGGTAVAETNAAPALPPVYEDEAIAKENYYEFENYESDGALRADTPQEESGQKPVQDAAAFGSFQSETGGVNKENPAYIGDNGLAGGDFYEQTKGEIERLLKNYPKAESLSNLIENSDWVKISYGDNLFYVFGVIYSGGKAEYICYGVPAVNSERPPESMKELASYIPAPDGGFTGFWVMYQDAKTGATLKVAGA